MCGIGGHAGIKDQDRKMILSWALGSGIDKRGGHGAGFVSITNGNVTVDRKLGEWGGASYKFLRRAAVADICAMHSRFATCGKRTVDEVHPFKIQRGGKSVLWGMHNGIIWDAETSARRNNRPYSVDSKELFEAFADKDIDGIQEMMGYGVVAYILASDTSSVRLVRLSEQSDLEVAKIKGSGTVWGSTKYIVNAACEAAGLEIEYFYKCEDIGREYLVNDKGVWIGNDVGFKVGDYTAFRYREEKLDREYFEKCMSEWKDPLMTDEEMYMWERYDG